jgi:hypothetical protein
MSFNLSDDSFHFMSSCSIIAIDIVVRVVDAVVGVVADVAVDTEFVAVVVA